MRKLICNKSGNILTENIIFIILNLVFISILLLFVFSKMSSAAVLEEKYAKQVALIIDSAEPVMSIDLEMEDAIKIAEREGIDLNTIITKEGNMISVKLRDGGGYSYSFFNNVSVDLRLNTDTNKGYNIWIE
ncbi:MAG: hypothetical protein WDZ62_01010 [Candidatus Pacearchaeota archaeon]